MPHRDVSPETVEALRKWLGDDGVSFFRECRRDYGTVSPCLPPPEDALCPVPHPVHFREGMQVRNFLRTTPECKDWGPHDLDDSWMGAVERAIRETP